MDPSHAADGDDGDYMGDLSLFLPPDHSPPSRDPSRRKHAAPAPCEPAGRAKRAKGVPWRERRRNERERRQQEEDERTMAGLAEAIPETNVGFKLLKQMGYNPGEGLRHGRAEPVGIEIRRSRAGLGTEPPPPPPPPPEARRREAAERESRRAEEMAAELRSRQSTRWRSRRVVWDYRKAEAALAQLENVEVEAEEEEEEEKGDEEEEEEVITAEDLQNILAKLRGQHHYCLYCGCKYESAEALANECPGMDEDDH